MKIKSLTRLDAAQILRRQEAEPEMLYFLERTIAPYQSLAFVMLFWAASLCPPVHANRIQNAKKMAVDAALSKGSTTKNGSQTQSTISKASDRVPVAAAAAAVAGAAQRAAGSTSATNSMRRAGRKSGNAPGPSSATRAANSSGAAGPALSSNPRASSGHSLKVAKLKPNRKELEKKLKEAEKVLAGKEKIEKQLARKHRKIQRRYWSGWQEETYLKLRSFVRFGGAYGLALGAGYYDLAEGYHGQKSFEHLLTHVPETVGGFSKFFEYAASSNWEAMGKFLENVPPDGVMIGGSAFLLTLSVFDKVRSDITHAFRPSDKKLSGAVKKQRDAFSEKLEAEYKKLDIEIELIGAIN